MLLIILGIIGIAMVCYAVAQEKGLNATLWGIFGFLFGFFTLILLMFIPNKNK